MQKPGLGQRLVARIKAKGYADPDSKFGIRVTEFALDHRYPPGSVFKWIGDVVVPDYETILRLARDLDASPGWLHYGDEPLPQPHGHGPSRGKAPRRQGRRIAGSLVLALMCGAASLLGWPGLASAGGAAAPPPLPAVVQRDPVSLIRRWLHETWARTLHGSWCPA